jgi:fructan beta-fructosidase
MPGRLFIGFILIALVTGCALMPIYATTLYDEVFRPQFHYSPPCRWMNDPNGLVYHDGEYHLFYQFHPDGLTWGPMHWGHAVSTDLVHWQTLPIALFPDEHGTIFSGSVVIDHNNTAGFGEDALVAVYSYHTQTQGIAYSTDNGRTWAKYEGNPVIDALAPDFRDPKVFWHEASQRWVAPITAGRAVQFFVSENLRDWEFASRFTGGHVTAIWEVPDLFPLEINGETKWVLLVSVSRLAPAAGSGIQYFIGDFDDTTFTSDHPTEVLWLDYGPDNYAGTTWNNAPQDQRIYIGWMNNWLYAEHLPTTPWRGATTLPRELSLAETPAGIRLVQQPVAAFQALREPLGTWDNITLTDPVPLDSVRGRTFEIIAEFEVGDAERVGIEVHQGDETDGTRILFNSRFNQLVMSRADHAGGNLIHDEFNPAFGAPITLENNALKLHIFVDEASVEVFADDGSIVITGQTFADPAADRVSLFAENGEAIVRHLEVYALRSVWDTDAEMTTEYDFCR